MDEHEKAEMLAKADIAVQNASQEFVGGLKQRVQDLEQAIYKNDRDTVLQIAYNLETEASTFGWPRVTRISKWLRKVFSGDVDHKPEAEDVLKILNTLKTMVSDPDNSDEKRDEELFREIFPTLKNAVTDI